MLTSVLPKVYRGALSPEALRVHVRQGESGIDLTTVTGVSLLVQFPNGTEETWAGVIATGPTPPAVTPTDLWIVHAYVAGDVDALGEYAAVAILTVPGGVVRAEPRPFRVVSEFG